ncbi:LEAF RUST 10 DISEASE-RESISTANCE LOCUS RECEPTOR-LIKE PROTEIN KINASE-like 2.1 [Pistacia vera]|uniref:LEAF RUST 10 DISEASE-RESISTANCE LOCUS RECEPTOR-LIKE PROTEIN KINASE-like 2.1 n=1 Tax=Pistacia vera TaxID=55513 RepID=UPI001263047A|nr:LEAF RUST 10 DISEASE-RESISTANCE LOCUS RECEPTOR-LIKE PROTEIN KINASE-like 2.1 [Pistacia vera]
MNNNLFPPLALHYMIFTLFCILIAIPSSYCDDELYEACRNPHPFSCGGSVVLNLLYPFWGDGRRRECGKNEFELTCEDDLHPIINFPSQKFRVLDINTNDQTVTILRYDHNWDLTVCPERPAVSVNFNGFLSNYSSNVRNLSLFYNCTDKSPPGSNTYTCRQQGSEDRKGFYTIDDEPDYFPNLTNTCGNVTKVPILFTAALDKNKNEPQNDLEWLREILDMGLQVKYEAENRLCSACQSSAGICGSNYSNSGEFVCFCRDKPCPHTCPVMNGMHALPTLFLIHISLRCIYSNFSLV